MKRKILKILGLIFLILVAVLIYMAAGALLAYHKQPEIKEDTVRSFKASSLYGKSDSAERAAIIEKNGQALLERVRMIYQAKESVVLSSYAFHSDESGKVMLGALLDAAERDVEIKILVDGFDSWISMEGNEYFYALSSHENVKIKIYNRANPLLPWKSMGRMHDKYLIADNHFYMLGGRNTFNYFLGDYPGHKNYDRDVLVYCEKPNKDSSIFALQNYFQNMWNYKECRLFHDKEKLSDRESVIEAKGELVKAYEEYVVNNKTAITDTNYDKDTAEVEKITLLSNPTTYQSKEPVLWYKLCEVMKNAKKTVRIHTPYIICNDMMYGKLEEITGNVPEVSIMTNSIANNGNPFGAGDYAVNRDRIMETGVDIWEYEGGYSYHGKSILVDDDLSIIGSFNLDMRSVYLNTELMLVIHSKEINQKLNENMQQYEQSARQYLGDGSYYNPHSVEPVVLTKQHKRKMLIIQKLIGWARFLF